MRPVLAALLAALALTPWPALATTPTRGDVTSDGFINSADALLILQFDARLIDTISNVRGDVNRDGRVSPIDAALVLQLDAGVIGDFPR